MPEKYHDMPSCFTRKRRTERQYVMNAIKSGFSELAFPDQTARGRLTIDLSNRTSGCMHPDEFPLAVM